MAINKNALIRYKTIDKCLQNRYRKWTLDDLIDACSDALYEYEGKQTNVSKRTVQLDIQTMRSDKLGYNAPIIVVDRKYYTYEDPNYSITNLPVSINDLEKLTQSVSILKQFKGFSHFKHLNDVVQKLEDYVYTRKNNAVSIIDFEKNDLLKGIERLDELYKYILEKQSLMIEYQSFKNRYPNKFIFFPYLLKEYRNRWFLIGSRQGQDKIINLALDRIEKVEKSDYLYKNTNINFENYYKNVIGVSVDAGIKPQEIKIFIDRKISPYVLTKPLHHSQRIISRNKFGTIIRIYVQYNFELEKQLLSFGENIRVISPEKIKKKVYNNFQNAINLYETDINIGEIKSMINILKYRSCVVLNNIYMTKELKKISNYLFRIYPDLENKKSIDLMFDDKLKGLIINENIEKILKNLPQKYQLKDIVFYPLITEENKKWKQEFYYDEYIRIKFRLGYNAKEKTVFEVFEGTQNKLLSKKMHENVINNFTSGQCKVENGGVLIYDPRILHRHLGKGKKRNSYIELILKS